MTGFQIISSAKEQIDVNNPLSLETVRIDFRMSDVLSLSISMSNDAEIDNDTLSAYDTSVVCKLRLAYLPNDIDIILTKQCVNAIQTYLGNEDLILQDIQQIEQLPQTEQSQQCQQTQVQTKQLQQQNVEQILAQSPILIKCANPLKAQEFMQHNGQSLTELGELVLKRHWFQIVIDLDDKNIN